MIPQATDTKRSIAWVVVLTAIGREGGTQKRQAEGVGDVND